MGIYSNPWFREVILLDPLRPVLIIYPYLVNFLIFTNCHISPEWCHIICFVIIGNVSYQSTINYVILCHHIYHFIIHAMSSLPLSFLWLILSSLCHHVLGYSFVITGIFLTSMTTIIHISNNIPLWHWWQHLNLLSLWQQWQRITCYFVEDFLSFFFQTTPPVIIYPLC